MSSQLQQLRQRIEQLADQAAKTAQQLSAFDATFRAQVEQVNATIGGSAQQRDRQVIATLEGAAKQVTSAAEALQGASRVASEYGSSL